MGLVLDAKEVHGMQHSTVIEFPGDSVKKAKFWGKKKMKKKKTHWTSKSSLKKKKKNQRKSKKKQNKKIVKTAKVDFKL